MKTYTPPSRLRISLSRVFNHDAWYMAYPYDPEWDAYVYTAMLLNMVHLVPLHSDFVVDIGNQRIWVGNYPYSYAVADTIMHIHGRPSYRTIKMLRKHINQLEREYECSRSENS